MAVRAAVSSPTSLVAPVFGLNTRDGLGDMDPRYAVQMDNFFPQNGSVDIRGGQLEHADGMTNEVNSLIPWNGPTTTKFFAGNGANIFDVTASGAVGAAVVTGQTSDKYQYQNITTTGGSFVFLVNGEDAPYTYDGTVWANPAITGITPADVVNVFLFKNRLWLVLNDSIDAYYLPTSAIAGAATKFPLGAVFREGGYLQTMIALSKDSGAGADDYMAFISSEGEVAVYQGTDPASSTTWALVGVYRIGKPIGRRSAFKFGGDGVVITQDGVLSLTKMTDLDRAGAAAASLTDVINPTFNSDARSYGSNFGWQGMIYPKGKWLFVNVPQTEGDVQYQYVMNTITSAWCKFTGFDANCWAIFGDSLYYGTNDGRVMIVDTNFTDEGNNITGSIAQAFSYFGARGRIKHFKMIRPLIRSSGTINYSVSMDVDYATATAPMLGPGGLTSGWIWGEDWGSLIWGGSSNTIRPWKGLNKIGTAASIIFSGVVRGASLSLVSYDIVYETGGVL